MLRVALVMLFALPLRGATNQFEFYGDSITAGLLSYTDLSAQNTLPSVSGILSDFVNFAATQDYRYIERHERRQLAWPNSVARSLAPRENSVAIKNFARTRAKSEDLLRQTALVASDNSTPSTAFFFIGHNDIAAIEGPVEEVTGQFIHYYSESLNQWDERHQNSTAFLVTIGDMTTVFEALNNYIWYQSGVHAFRCQEMWEKYFLYARRLGRIFRSNSLREFVDPRRKAMNERLSELATLWNKHTTRNNQFKVISPLEDLGVETKFFAIDCYHLSTFGQDYIATHVLKSIP